VTRFWDSSAVIPLVVEESKSGLLLSLLRDDERMAVWWGTWVECLSALSRQRRDGSLTQDQESQARTALRLSMNTWSEVQPIEQVRTITERVLEMHPLKAADALQLAAALLWSELAPAQRAFVSLDGRLREAARKEGFSVLPSG